MTAIAIRNRDITRMLSKYRPYFENDIALLNKARKGLQPQAVFDFIRLAEIPNDRVEIALNRSLKTFQNYKDKKTLLDAVTSEKLLKLFALYSRGEEVFGSVDAFSDWLSRPAYGLGNEVPLHLLDTITGIELINDEIIRIEFGDLA